MNIPTLSTVQDHLRRRRLTRLRR